MRQRQQQILTIVVLLLTVACMGVFFAAGSYTANLQINGNTTKAKAASWNVQFVEDAYTETGTVSATTHSVSATTASYTVTLEKPGDTYSFNTTIKNEGTLDATLNKITLSGVSEEQAKYIEYTVSYAGVQYNTTTENLAIDLKAGQSASVSISVKYVLPEDSSSLPKEDQVLTLTASFDYLSAV